MSVVILEVVISHLDIILKGSIVVLRETIQSYHLSAMARVLLQTLCRLPESK